MRAGRIPIADTAFSVARQKKSPRVENGQHLKAIRELPCCVCGTRKEIEAAHIRMANRRLGKLEAGIGAKPDDAWVTPLCAAHHRLLPNSQHNVGEANFWAAHGVDPFLLALALWRASGRTGEMEMIVAETLNAKRGHQ